MGLHFFFRTTKIEMTTIPISVSIHINKLNDRTQNRDEKSTVCKRLTSLQGVATRNWVDYMKCRFISFHFITIWSVDELRTKWINIYFYVQQYHSIWRVIMAERNLQLLKQRIVNWLQQFDIGLIALQYSVQMMNDAQQICIFKRQ